MDNKSEYELNYKDIVAQFKTLINTVGIKRDVPAIKDTFFMLLHDWPSMGPSYFAELFKTIDEAYRVDDVEEMVLGFKRPPFEMTSGRVRFWCDAMIQDINPLLAMNFFNVMQDRSIHAIVLDNEEAAKAYSNLLHVDECGVGTFLQLLGNWFDEAPFLPVVNHEGLVEKLNEVYNNER